MKYWWILILALCIGALILTLTAGDGRPAVTLVYAGEKGDLGYNDQAYLGLTHARDVFNVKSREIVYNASNIQDPVRNENGSAKMVVMVGDTLSEYANQYAKIYPQTPITVIDANPVPGGNVRSIYFSMYGPSFLAGVLAANLSKTGKIGVIGGKQFPVISQFVDGYVDGARTEDPDVIVNITYLANDDTGFRMPDRAGLIAQSMYQNGTDIIYTVAGGSGIGVISAANHLPGLYVIGVDSDQSDLGPRVVIASVVKNLTQTVYREIKTGLSGDFSKGSIVTGLSDGGSSLIYNPRYANLAHITETRIPEALSRENDRIHHP